MRQIPPLSLLSLHVENLQITAAAPSVKDLPMRLESATARIALTLEVKRHITGISKEAPPELPRVLIASPRLNIHVGLDRVQITFPVDGPLARNVLETFPYFAKKIGTPEIDAVFVAINEPVWMGAVLNIVKPVPDATTGARAVEPIARQAASIRPFGEELASFNLLCGFRAGGLFKNVTVQGYDSYTVDLVDGRADSPTKRESGVQYILDINTKPQQVRPYDRADLAQLLREMEQFFIDLPTIIPGAP